MQKLTPKRVPRGSRSISSVVLTGHKVETAIVGEFDQAFSNLRDELRVKLSFPNVHPNSHDPKIVLETLDKLYEHWVDWVNGQAWDWFATGIFGLPNMVAERFYTLTIHDRILLASLSQSKKRQWGKFFKTRHRNLKKADNALYIRVPHR